MESPRHHLVSSRPSLSGINIYLWGTFGGIEYRTITSESLSVLRKTTVPTQTGFPEFLRFSLSPRRHAKPAWRIDIEHPGIGVFDHRKFMVWALGYPFQNYNKYSKASFLMQSYTIQKSSIIVRTQSTSLVARFLISKGRPWSLQGTI